MPGQAPPAADPWVTAIEVLPTAIRDPAHIPPPQPPPAPLPEARWPYHLPRWSAIDCLWWATLVRASYAPTDTFLRRAAEWAGPVSRLLYVAPTAPEVVGRAFVELPDQWLCVIPGTSNDAERNAYVLTHALASVGYNLVPGGSFSLNTTWLSRGELIWAAAQAWPYPVAKPLTVIGHSAGGGSAVVPFIRHQLAAGEAAAALVSYGSMIWGMPDTNSLLTSWKAQVIEFTTQGDPIPLLPPPWSLIDLLRLPYPQSNRPTYVRYGALLELRGVDGAYIRPSSADDTERILAAIINFMRGALSIADHSARFYSRIALDWARRFAAQHGYRDLLEPLELLHDDMAAAGL